MSAAKTESEIDAEIQNNNIKAIIFEPTLSLGDDQCIDVLNKLIPELANTRNGQKVTSSKYGYLEALIQTNFYSYPGVYKFRVFMLSFRASSTMLKISTSNFQAKRISPQFPFLPLTTLSS